MKTVPITTDWEDDGESASFWEPVLPVEAFEGDSGMFWDELDWLWDCAAADDQRVLH
jgi:hypothetical protein